MTPYAPSLHVVAGLRKRVGGGEIGAEAMMQVIAETREEKIARYRKMKKRDLAEMLVNAQDALAAQAAASKLSPSPHFVVHHYPPSPTIKELEWPQRGTTWRSRVTTT